MKPDNSGGGAKAAQGSDGDSPATGDARFPVGEIGLSGIGRLESELKRQGVRALPPIERWNPPYCGDIGLAIARDGTWSYRGSPIRRVALVKLFATVLMRESDGRHYLVTPAEKVDVAVEDAPFLAVEMEVIGAGSKQTLVLRTNLDDVVRAGREHPLSFASDASGGWKPYLLVRGRLWALVTRALTYDLAELIEADGAGQSGLWSGGVFFPVPAGV